MFEDTVGYVIRRQMFEMLTAIDTYIATTIATYIATTTMILAPHLFNRVHVSS